MVRLLSAAVLVLGLAEQGEAEVQEAKQQVQELVQRGHDKALAKGKLDRTPAMAERVKDVLQNRRKGITNAKWAKEKAYHMQHVPELLQQLRAAMKDPHWQGKNPAETALMKEVTDRLRRLPEGTRLKFDDATIVRALSKIRGGSLMEEDSSIASLMQGKCSTWKWPWEPQSCVVPESTTEELNVLKGGVDTAETALEAQETSTNSAVSNDIADIANTGDQANADSNAIAAHYVAFCEANNENFELVLVNPQDFETDCNSLFAPDNNAPSQLQLGSQSRGGGGDSLQGGVRSTESAITDFQDEVTDDKKELRDERQETVGDLRTENDQVKKSMRDVTDDVKNEVEDESKSARKQIKRDTKETKDSLDTEMDEIDDALKDGKKDQQEVIDSYAGKNRDVDAMEDAGLHQDKMLEDKEKDADREDQKIGKYEAGIEKTFSNLGTQKVFDKLVTKVEKFAGSTEGYSIKQIAQAASDAEKDYAKVEKDSGKQLKTTEKAIAKEQAKIHKRFNQLLGDMLGVAEDAASVCKTCTSDELDEIAAVIGAQIKKASTMYLDAVAQSKSDQDTDLADVASGFDAAVDQLSVDVNAQVMAEMEAMRKEALAKMDAPAQAGQIVMQSSASKVSQVQTLTDSAANQAKSQHRAVEELNDATQDAETVAASEMAKVKSTEAETVNALGRERHETSKIGVEGFRDLKRIVKTPSDEGPSGQKPGSSSTSGGKMGNPVEDANVIVEIESSTRDSLNQETANLVNQISKQEQLISQRNSALERSASQEQLVSNQDKTGIEGIASADVPKLQRDTYQSEMGSDKAVTKLKSQELNSYQKLSALIKLMGKDFKKHTATSVDSLVGEVSPVVQSQALDIISALMNIKALTVETEDKDKLRSQEIMEALQQASANSESLAETLQVNGGYPSTINGLFDKAEGTIGLGPIAQQKAMLLEHLKSSERAVVGFLDSVSQSDTKSTKDVLNELMAGINTETSTSEQKLDDLVQSIARNMARQSQGVESERMRIDGVKGETVNKCKEIEAMLKQLENQMHDSATGLEQKVDQDLMASKKGVASLGELSNDELAKVSAALRGQLEHAMRALGDQSATYDASVLKQVDDSLFYMNHDRSQSSKEIAAMLQLLAAKETQVKAADKSAETAEENGRERWATGSEENKQRADLLVRQFQTRATGEDPAAAGQGRQEVSGERMSSSIDTLGEQTEDISGKAADEVEIAGSSVTSSAKTGEAELQMNMAKIESQEQKAFEEQNQRDRQLAEAVGLDLSKMNEVQVQAMRDYAASAAARSQVSNLLTNENESLEKNTAYLEHYNQVTGENLMKIMGEVAMQIEKAMHSMNKDQSYLDGVQTGTEMRVDDLMGSEAVQSLQKIAGADELSMKVEMEDEFLAEWMQDFQHEADSFRARVEKGFATSDEAMELHQSEIEKSEQEAKDRDAMLEGKMVAGIGAMAKEVDFGGVGGVEEGFEAGIGAFDDKTKTTNALDNMRINGLASILGSVSSQFGAKMADAKGDMSHLRNAGKTEAQNVKVLRDMLDNMITFYDAEASRQQKVLSERQQRFQDDLLLAGVSAGGEAPVLPPTPAETASLLAEAQSLALKHDALEEKHDQMGAAIGTLLAKLTDVVGKVNDQAKA